jgi:hypothetical protein
MLRPTIRKPGSELWFSWNPRRKTDPVDDFLRGGHVEGAVVVEANWRDNPWFPDEMEAERLLDRERNPRRYAHIWEGAYEPAVVGAIWDVDGIARERFRELPCEAERIVVAVDPAGSAPHKPPPSKREIILPATGIVAVAKGADGNGYVLRDRTMTGSPVEWGRAVVALYDELDADAVVVETNYGGDMATNTIRAIRPTIPIIEVRATRGKHIRAEPIASLYQQGRFFHVGSLPELEAEMSQMTANGYQGNGSPNRVDALVWGGTEIFSRILTAGRKKSVAARPRASNAGGWMG